jgi:hypothetical protein
MVGTEIAIHGATSFYIDVLGAKSCVMSSYLKRLVSINVPGWKRHSRSRHHLNNIRSRVLY